MDRDERLGVMVAGEGRERQHGPNMLHHRSIKHSAPVQPSKIQHHGMQSAGSLIL